MALSGSLTPTNRGGAGSSSGGAGLRDSLVTRGGYDYTAPVVTPQYTPAQQHTINSFKTLDAPTRQTMLGSFRRTDPAKYQLLKDHASDGVPQNTSFQDAPTFKNPALNWLSNAATDTIAKPAIRGGVGLTRLANHGTSYDPLTNTTNTQKFNGKQFAADALQTGTNGFLGGAKIAATAAKAGADGLVKFGGKEIARLIAKRAASGAATNAGLNAATTYGAGGNAKQVAQSAAEGAAFGAGLGGIGGGFAARAGGRAANVANTAVNKGRAAGSLQILNDAKTTQKALPAPSGKALTTTPKELASGKPLQLGSGGVGRTMTAAQTAKLSEIDKQITDIQASRANPKVVNSQLQTARAAGDTAGVKAAATARNAISIKANLTNAHTLNDLLEKRTNLYDEVHNPSVKAGPDVKPLSRTDRKVAAIDGQLTDFKQNPRTTMTPEAAKILQKQRNDLINGRTQVTLDRLAGKHSAETGQPVAIAHDTIKQGNSAYSGEYTAAQAEGKQAKATVGQDWVAPKSPVNPHDELTASSPNRSGEAQKQGGAIRSAYNEARSWFGAPTASPLSRETSMGLNNANASASNARQQLKELAPNKAAETHFNTKSETENVANISHYERTGSFNAEPRPGYSAQYQNDMNKAHEVMAHVYGDDKTGYVDNYVRRNLEFKSEQDGKSATNILMKQFGSKSPLKGRVMDMPLDEALQTLRDKGIDVKPVTHNPEGLRQWTMINAHKAYVYDQAFKDSIKAGNVSTIPKQGMVPIPREVLQALSPAQSGKDHFAYPEVLKILQNATGRGLKDNAVYKGARAASAGLGQITLALPAFHAVNMVQHSLASEINNAMLRARVGDLGGAGRSLLNSATVVGPAVKNFVKGNSLMKEVKAGTYGPDTMEMLNLSGAHLGMSHQMESGAIHAVKKLWSGTPSVVSALKIAGLSPFAVAEGISNPLMKSAIPRIKLGAMMDRAAQIVDEKGGLHAPGTQEALQNAQRSIDNRLGEIVMSNKQWNPVARDISQLLYLSVGYRAGTVGELSGGLKDLGKTAITALQPGRKMSPLMTERSTFLASTLIAAAYTGAIYQYLHTGKMPQSLSEAIYPKNGQNDQNGNPVRVRLPGYATDLLNLVTNPSKEVAPNAPFLKAIQELATNKDWKGDLIHNPADSPLTQAGQVGKNIAGRLVPIAAQNQTKANGINKLEALLMGASKAPATVGQTKADKEINDLLNAQPGLGGAKTPEQQATTALKAKARTDLAAGKTTSPNVQQLQKQLSPTAYKDFLATKNENSIQRGFDLLSTENKVKLIQDNNPADLKGVSLNKWLVTAANDYKTGNVKDPAALKSAMTKVGVTASQFNDLLKQGKAQRHQTYISNRGKPKTNNKW